MTSPTLSQSSSLSTSPSGLDAHTSISGMKALAGNPNLLVSGVPEVPAELKSRLNQYLNARIASLHDVTPDGKGVLITTRFGNTAQLHSVDHPMGARTQLTFFEEPVAGGAFARSLAPGSAESAGETSSIFFLQDVGGGEAYQIFRLGRRTGRAERLTDGKSRHGSLTLSRDGRRAAFTSTFRNGKDTDVYVTALDAEAWTTAAHRLTEEEGSWYAADFSPDGTRLLLGQFRAIDDAELWLADVSTGERVRLTPAQGKGSVAAAAFAADGKSVYFVTDRYSDFNELYRLDLSADGKRPAADISTSSPTPLSRSLRWNVEELAVAPDGSRVAFAVNEEGLSRLYLLNPQSGTLTPADLPEPGVIGTLLFPQDRSDILFLSADTSRSPSDVFSFDLTTERFTRWTRSEVGGLDTSRFVEPELVRYPSTGGVSVPAFLYKPAAPAPASRTSKFPVLVIWHGGPEGQSRPNFSSFIQFLTNELGIAVLLPNVRGSDGYGKAYLALDDGVKREESLMDIGATLDWIASRPDLDADRIAVYGGSYGGFMVLATAVFYPERIRAVVDVVGISSIPSFLQNTQAYRRDLRRREYGDERDPAVREVQERISPLNHVDRIQAALFVQQGKNDPRVPQSEAEQIVSAVRARHSGDPASAWYLLALDEGHGFAKKLNRDHALLTTVLFLQEKLLH